VVADSCNPWELTRREWEAVAAQNGAEALNIEVLCSDTQEHHGRVETRKPEVAGLKLPTWEEIHSREYHPWNTPRITIDTAGRSIAESFAELNGEINRRIGSVKE
jgi:predicted kinase